MSLIGRRSIGGAKSVVRADAGSIRARAAAIGIALACAAWALVAAQPAGAYVVCSQQCPHEYMAKKALDVFAAGEVASNFGSVQAGITEEDEFDHVYGLNIDIPLAGQPLVTATHFWDADLGPDAPATNAAILGTFQNSWQKVRALWMLALGAYAKGDKPLAYHYLGHIVHHFGDNTVPAHVHDDPHGPEPIDDDSFHDWMDTKDDNGGEPTNARVSQAEMDVLKAAGPIAIPDGELDKLHFLLYDENEYADFFASDDYDGDSTAAGYDGSSAGRLAVQAELDKLAADPNLVRLQDEDEFDDNDDDDDNDDGDLGVVRQYSYLRGIRSIAALYKLFEETVRDQITATVTIDEVTANDWHDYGEVCLPNPFGDDVCAQAKVSSADFYARLDMGNRQGRNRGEQAKNDDHIAPGWTFGHTVGTSGTLPVGVEIWDHDGAYDEFTTGGSDDVSDIKPGDGTGLNLSVDIAKCLTGADGAVTGDATGKCGVPITSSGGDKLEASTVRFTIRLSKSPPKAHAGGPYTTDEGANVELSATGSTDPDNDITTYAWDLDGDGACDDVVNDATPDFTAVGQDGTTTVKVCVTDAVGLTSEDTAEVKVNNVAPAIEISDPSAIVENSSVTVGGTIRDPGWEDPLSATIGWGDGTAAETLPGAAEHVRPDATLTFSTAHTYGDNGTYTIKVCTADDDTTPCRSVAVTVTNVNPTAAVDTSGTVTVNGIPTVIAHAGRSVDFGARITDPGSDDLSVTWNWGDGTPAQTSTSLVNPPALDPPSSPSIQPRNISAASGHAFGKACVYTSGLAVIDDDAGSAAGSLNVIIVGNNHPNRPHGYWKQQSRYHAFATGPAPDVDAGTLHCYLDIAAYMSRVFNERTAAATFAQAYDVFDTSSTNDMNELFDQQLLAAWLNFANGAIEWNRLVDTNGDKTADTPFLTAIQTAESLRINPTATRKQLDTMKQIVEGWTNLR